MKTIPIKRHPHILIMVDDEDYEKLKDYTWRINKNREMVYAVRPVTKSEQLAKNYPASIKIHREIMGIADNKKLLVDHEDHNGLNNQKKNLRVCDGHQNQGNRRKLKTNTTSKYKGVFYNSTYSHWVAHIKQNGKRTILARLGNEQDCALEYNKEAVKRFGEFAYLNIIKPF